MRLWTDRRGTGAPEFAVVCGAVMMLFVAVVDLGTLYTARHALAHGLDKAARFAAVRAGVATPESVAATFRAAVASALGDSATNQVAVSVSYPGGNNVGATVVISATYGWKATSGAGLLPPVSLSVQQVLTILH